MCVVCERGFLDFVRLNCRPSPSLVRVACCVQYTLFLSDLHRTRCFALSFSGAPPPAVSACKLSAPLTPFRVRPLQYDVVTTGEARITVPLAGRAVLLLGLACVHRVPRRAVVTRHGMTSWHDVTAGNETERDRTEPKRVACDGSLKSHLNAPRKNRLVFDPLGRLNTFI